MKESKDYAGYKKPAWAPPSWVFAPVWTLLYISIAISYGAVAYLFYLGHIDWLVLVPFVLNLAFNFSFTPIQFGLEDFRLALVDILLTLATLIWAMVAIYATAPWISFVTIPYLLWLSFATALQTAVVKLNT